MIYIIKNGKKGTFNGVEGTYYKGEDGKTYWKAKPKPKKKVDMTGWSETEKKAGRRMTPEERKYD